MPPEISTCEKMHKFGQAKYDNFFTVISILSIAAGICKRFFPNIRGTSTFLQLEV
jgi:hypothetical protein